MADELLIEPLPAVPSASHMRVESAKISVDVALVASDGGRVRNVEFSVEILARNPDGTFKWGPVARNRLIDSVKQMAQLVGKIP